ncbi:hypothetical protein LTR10_019374 [Elasticomyces elasticus]|uniref:Uncharacterized protein n=1 Tax=Exophiala sideris TaxID=1016849 RepID=A0ABR0IVA4_9EURO|nr:hypothetical protein LTR10_019374 [Elasticomyces elasticus]KAK5021415.1 hypothetical protein LTS07_011025 [Exophiala sideris]KAK5025413.1 hypothetical protein LTR13_010490 [Exophiala sideris]KAK5049264.1 hypothetical protein LTR69_011049 [Exophiala sideris]KAK5176937.1 hypothetical protein LTR44_010510 [Eurotiomycetes sp. CCFEE 6388]
MTKDSTITIVVKRIVVLLYRLRNISIHVHFFSLQSLAEVYIINMSSPPTITAPSKDDWRSIQLHSTSLPEHVNPYLAGLQEAHLNVRIGAKEICGAKSTQTGTMALVATGQPATFQLTPAYRTLLDTVPQFELDAAVEEGEKNVEENTE